MVFNHIFGRGSAQPLFLYVTYEEPGESLMIRFVIKEWTGWKKPGGGLPMVSVQLEVCLTVQVLPMKAGSFLSLWVCLLTLMDTFNNGIQCRRKVFQLPIVVLQRSCLLVVFLRCSWLDLFLYSYASLMVPPSCHPFMIISIVKFPPPLHFLFSSSFPFPPGYSFLFVIAFSFCPFLAFPTSLLPFTLSSLLTLSCFYHCFSTYISCSFACPITNIAPQVPLVS